jgi:predicted nuclease of predicted toxin-antitoxin system
MRLLFDANLSPLLVRHLKDLYPGSLHVEQINEVSAQDPEIWNYAKENDLIIVTKDSDFEAMSQLSNEPPKIIWIRRGNCSTAEIEEILRNNSEAISSLSLLENELTILILY